MGDFTMLNTVICNDFCYLKRLKEADQAKTQLQELKYCVKHLGHESTLS